MKKLIYKSLGLYLNTLTRMAPEKGGKLAFKIFCTPQKKKLSPAQLDFLQTANRRNFDFNGQAIKIYEWGTGPKKILFVHGWQSHSFRWKKYIEAFPKEEFTLIAFDAPAHGLSEGKQFTVPQNAFLIALLARYYHGFGAVVSHSIGSFSVFYALATYELPPIGKLVSMASPGRASEFIDFYMEALNLKANTVTRIKHEFQKYAKEELDNISCQVLVEKLRIHQLIFMIGKTTDSYENGLEILRHWKRCHFASTMGGGNLRRELVQVGGGFCERKTLRAPINKRNFSKLKYF